MIKLTIKNPTSQGKAVKVGGDLLVIKPGETSKEIEVDWTEDQKVKYTAAGLVFKELEAEPKAEAKTPPPAPKTS